MKPARFGLLFSAASLLALLFFVSNSFCEEIMPGLYKKTFSNGFTTIVKQSSRAPVTAVQVWVKAGSSYETDKEAGLTHLIEHMIFKGTKRRGPGEIAREIESIGGTINAYTSMDYTVYHCVVPRDYTDKALDILSDAIFHSTFDPAELEKEKKVVLEEMRMRDDRPGTRLYKLLMETSYQVHPYRRPVIGYPDTVTSFTRDDIKRYMARRYHPAFMSLVVTGDVDPGRVLEKANKFFGAQGGKRPEEPSFPQEPVQESPKVNSEHMEIQEGYLAITFTGIPDWESPDVPVLDVLASLLGQGNSSRLNTELKEHLQLVHTISASAFTPKGPGLFEITATLDPAKTKEAVAGALKEIYRLAASPPAQDELDKAKTMVETDFVYTQEQMEGMARTLGLFQTLSGNPLQEKIYLQRIRQVTPLDIQEVAKKYFNTRNINVVMVLPEGAKVELSPETLTVIAEQARAKPEKQEPAAAMDEVISPATRLVLSNGLTVLIKANPDVPTVAARIVFPGGLRYERKENNGLFNFLAKAWNKGTKKYDAQQLSEIVESMGGALNGFSGRNTFGLQASFLSKNLAKGLDIFSEVLLHPIFPEEEVEKLKPLIIAQIKQQEDSPVTLAIKEFRRLLYAPHPYGMNELGTPETVKNISPDMLRKTYAKYVVPDGAVLSIVGDVDVQELVSDLERLLGAWILEEEEIPNAPPRPEPFTTPRFLNIKRDIRQVHIVLGFPGTTITSPDRYPTEVLNAILAGQGGRLFTELRDKESLAYSLTSFVGLGLDYGSFAFYIGCAPEKKDKAIKALWREIYKITNEPVDEKELERAKRWLIGTHEIGLQTNGAQAFDMALNELYGLGYNFQSRYVQEIGKVTPEAVTKAAKRIFNTEHYALVKVGPL